MWIGLISKLAWGAPDYRLRFLTELPAAFNLTSFTTGGTITGTQNGPRSFIYQAGRIYESIEVWPNAFGSSMLANDMGQYVSERERLYATSLGGELKLIPPDDWHQFAVAHHLTESGWMVGASEMNIFGEPSEVGYIFNLKTGQRRTLNPGTDLAGNLLVNSRLCAGNEHGRYAGLLLEERADSRGQVYTWANGKYTLLGELREETSTDELEVNNAGHVAWSNLRGQVKIWDGTTTQVWNNLNFFELEGMADDKTLAYTRLSGVGGPEVGVFTNGIAYRLQDITQNLPTGMQIRSIRMRYDGVMAGHCQWQGKDYLVQFTPVPEPASSVAIGLGCLALRRRRRVAG